MPITTNIPIIYLSILLILLVSLLIIVWQPIIIFFRHLIFQFNKKTLSKINDNTNISNINNHIYKKKWVLALNEIENYLLCQQINKQVSLQAKYYNTIGFIYQKNHYNKLAEKYYKQSLEISPTYLSAKKNLHSISK